MSIQKGLCVSRGNIKGIAYVICENDVVPEMLPQNTILITKALSRDMVKKLSPSIVGVVAEHGNIGSHGAGILRQLKIPCVIRIPGIVQKLRNGMNIEICGSENCVIIGDCIDDIQGAEYSGDPNLRYQNITKSAFALSDIRINLDWVCLRPNRFYHKLRYDMISDVFANSCSFLYGTPAGKTKLSSDGSIVAYGMPYISDLCSFILCNPSWFIEKAKERTVVAKEIKEQLSRLKPYTRSCTTENIEIVFENAVQLYQRLFQFSFLSQFVAEELLEVYADFVKDLTGVADINGLMCLRSTYVQESLLSEDKLGDAQKWGDEQHSPYIWDGTLDYTPLPQDCSISYAITVHPTNKEKLQLDYESFRQIIPLVYQLAEEFFYLSSSINSFATWSISNVFERLSQAKIINMTLCEFYELSLSDVRSYINQLKELSF